MSLGQNLGLGLSLGLGLGFGLGLGLGLCLGLGLDLGLGLGLGPGYFYQNEAIMKMIQRIDCAYQCELPLAKASGLPNSDPNLIPISRFTEVQISKGLNSLCSVGTRF
jgi:hypothetical protein